MPDSPDTLNTSNHQITKSDQPLVFAKEGRAVAGSRAIADQFGKNHRDVLRAIDDIVKQEPGCLRNFAQASFDVEGPNGGRASYRAFDMDRDGFTILAMGFTGAKALKWKLAYIAAFNSMEDALCRPADEQVARPGRRAQIDVARECRLTMGQNLRLAKMAGLLGNQAAISANRATTTMTGVDTLKLMGITHMTAPQNEALLSPTELGQRYGIGSGQAVNKLLCGIGFQTEGRDLKGHLYYEPTEAGRRAGGVMQDTGKKHSTGTPVRHLRWASSVGKYLQSDDLYEGDA